MKRGKRKGFMETMDVRTWTPDLDKIANLVAPEWRKPQAREDAFKWPMKPE